MKFRLFILSFLVYSKLTILVASAQCPDPRQYEKTLGSGQHTSYVTNLSEVDSLLKYGCASAAKYYCENDVAYNQTNPLETANEQCERYCQRRSNNNNCTGAVSNLSVIPCGGFNQLDKNTLEIQSNYFTINFSMTGSGISVSGEILSGAEMTDSSRNSPMTCESESKVDFTCSCYSSSTSTGTGTGTTTSEGSPGGGYPPGFTYMVVSTPTSHCPEPNQYHVSYVNAYGSIVHECMTLVQAQSNEEIYKIIKGWPGHGSTNP